MGLAWSPDGREIWFTQATREVPPNLYAVDLAGKVRPILKMPGWVWLHDIARDGRVLVGSNSWRAGVNWLRAGETREQDASWQAPTSTPTSGGPPTSTSSKG